MYLTEYVFNFECIPRSRVVGHVAIPCLTFEEHQTVSHSGCIILHFHEQSTKVLNFSTSLLTLADFCLFLLINSSGCEAIPHYGFDVHFPSE